jgi:hypothetical protein
MLLCLQVMSMLPLPWMLATFQPVIGLLCMLPYWMLGLRNVPKLRTLSATGARQLLKLAVFSAVGLIMMVSICTHFEIWLLVC